MKKILYLIGAAFMLLAGLLMSNVAYANDDREYVVLFKEKANVSIADQRRNNKSIVENVNGQVKKNMDNIQAMTVMLSQQEMKELKGKKDVLAVEENFKVKLSSQGLDWGIDKVKAQTAWTSGLTGQGVKVAVVDSGISPHYDLNIKGGIDLVPDGINSLSDGLGHGTHVAGIIAGLNNTNGYVGAAPGADLFAVKIFRSDGYTDLDIILSGLDWCIANDMDIVNMSFGSFSSSVAFEAMIEKAYNSGLILVAASGNNDNGTHTYDYVNYPAKYDEVIAVSAIDKTNLVASFSSSGPTVEVAAPGVNIISTFTNNDFAYASGTSMAAPYVAGTLALYKELYPAATNAQIRQMMINNAMDLGVAGRDKLYGYGLVQAPDTEKKDFTNFSVPGQSGSTVIDPINATIKLKVAPDVKVNSLVASFAVTAGVQSIKVGTVDQISGQTVNDFSTTKVYSIKAMDGSIKNWNVSIVPEPPATYFRSYVQYYGWQSWRSGGNYSGVSGKRIESIVVDLKGYQNVQAQAQTFVAGAGWQSWKYEGQVSGTIGRGIEMLRFKLTGTDAGKYDVYYRVYTKANGWLGWGRNGQAVGFEGLNKYIEAYQIRVVPKGTTGFTMTNQLLSAYGVAGLVRYSGYSYGIGWQAWKRDGSYIGTAGRALQAYRIRLGVNLTDGLATSGGISYSSYVAGVGWQAVKSNGTYSGVGGKRMETVKIKLTGAIATKYDVYYRVFVKGIGWMGWTKNGLPAGTNGYGYSVEALSVKLVAKGGAAPGSTSNSYRQK